MAWVPLGFVLIAMVYDLRTHEVPDWVPLGLLLWILLAEGFGWLGHGWESLCIGLAIGFGAALVLVYVLQFGGADAKLIWVLCGAVGHRDVLPLLFWIAVAGLPVALISKLRGQREFAYLPAVALGLLVFLVLLELRHAGVLS